MAFPATRRAFLAALAAASLSRAAFRDSKPFPEWSDDEIDKMLTDSPWAKPITVQFELGDPRGRRNGQTAPAEAYLTVRWSSALPVRQAILLDRLGINAAKLEVQETLKRAESEYVIEVFGLPAMAFQDGAGRLLEDVKKTASLMRNGGVLRPVSVEAPVYGEYLSATVRFARTVPITMEDREVEFQARMGTMELRSRFKLKQMVYQGRLEL